MSKHVWLVERLGPEALRHGMKGLALAVRKGLGYEEALRFSGYYTETLRQKSGGIYLEDTQVKFHDGKIHTFPGLWTSVVKSKHRYARGRNRDNYLLAGRKLLEQNHAVFGMVEGTPAVVLFDLLLEREGIQ